MVRNVRAIHESPQIEQDINMVQNKTNYKTTDIFGQRTPDIDFVI